MPALQVRDFPEDLYEQLRAYAQANHRSMAQQTIVAVDQMINGTQAADANPGTHNGVVLDFDTKAARQARIQKYREWGKRVEETNKRILERRGGVPVPVGLAVQWIREDRDNNLGHDIDLSKYIAQEA